MGSRLSSHLERHTFPSSWSFLSEPFDELGTQIHLEAFLREPNLEGANTKPRTVGLMPCRTACGFCVYGKPALVWSSGPAAGDTPEPPKASNRHFEVCTTGTVFLHLDTVFQELYLVAPRI